MKKGILYNKKFLELVQKLKQERKITQREISESLGKHKNFVADLKQGKGTVNKELFEKLIQTYPILNKLDPTIQKITTIVEGELQKLKGDIQDLSEPQQEYIETNIESLDKDFKQIVKKIQKSINPKNKQ